MIQNKMLSPDDHTYIPLAKPRNLKNSNVSSSRLEEPKEPIYRDSQQFRQSALVSGRKSFSNSQISNNSNNAFRNTIPQSVKFNEILESVPYEEDQSSKDKHSHRGNPSRQSIIGQIMDISPNSPTHQMNMNGFGYPQPQGKGNRFRSSAAGSRQGNLFGNQMQSNETPLDDNLEELLLEELQKIKPGKQPSYEQTEVNQYTPVQAQKIRQYRQSQMSSYREPKRGQTSRSRRSSVNRQSNRESQVSIARQAYRDSNLGASRASKRQEYQQSWAKPEAYDEFSPTKAMGSQQSFRKSNATSQVLNPFEQLAAAQIMRQSNASNKNKNNYDPYQGQEPETNFWSSAMKMFGQNNNLNTDTYEKQQQENNLLESVTHLMKQSNQNNDYSSYGGNQLSKHMLNTAAQMFHSAAKKSQTSHLDQSSANKQMLKTAIQIMAQSNNKHYDPTPFETDQQFYKLELCLKLGDQMFVFKVILSNTNNNIDYDIKSQKHYPQFPPNYVKRNDCVNYFTIDVFNDHIDLINELKIVPLDYNTKVSNIQGPKTIIKTYVPLRDPAKAQTIEQRPLEVKTSNGVMVRCVTWKEKGRRMY